MSIVGTPSLEYMKSLDCEMRSDEYFKDKKLPEELAGWALETALEDAFIAGYNAASRFT